MVLLVLSVSPRWLSALVLMGCVAAPLPGTPCVRSAGCSAPLACHFGRCRSACTADRDCGAGASCLLDADGVGTCSLDVDLGCTTGVGRACASGLVCVGDRCAQTCSATMGCATGSVCATSGGVSFCASPLLDGGVSDGGAIVAPCDALVDLTQSALDGGVGALTYRIDTTGAPLDGVLPLLACVSGATRVAHQVALRYRMRSNAFLRVDTHRPYTAADFDTVAGIFDGCGPSAATLACGDDDIEDPQANVVSGSPIPAGTEVVIGVGGFDPAGAGTVSSGLLEVLVEEVLLADPGEACDVTGQHSRCVGAACATLRTDQGSCLLATEEMEPNDRGSAEPVDLTTPVVMHGRVAADEEDCFSFVAPAGSSLVAVASDGRGACPDPFVNVTLTLLNAAGLMVTQVVGASPTPCPAIDATTSGDAHALAAGTYRLCMSASPGHNLDSYDLSLALVP